MAQPLETTAKEQVRTLVLPTLTVSARVVVVVVVVVVWKLWCAGFRHSAGLHARVILDGATCRLRELGDVRGVLSVLGVALVVPIVLRVLVS